jgi:hypothetical protein
MEMKLTLSRLTPDELRKILDFSRIKKVNLNNLVETQLLTWLRAMEQKFTDAGPCPSCRLRGAKSKMKGMPILDAEREGLIEIGPKSDRDLLKNTQYVICPRCLWWGFPEKK